MKTLKILLITLLIALVLLSGCTSIKFCNQKGTCASYLSLGKDHGYIQGTFDGKTVKVMASDANSSKTVESVAKGIVKGITK